MPTRAPRAASSFYSYSAKRSLRQEEVAAYRRIALATVIIVALLVGGYFLGIPLLGRLGAGSSPIVTHSPVGTADNIPPTSPRINDLPDISRTRTIAINGSAESGSTVNVLVNDREQLSTLTDKNGQFSGDISLTGGENTITATAKDSVGNKSRLSKAIVITYDASPPKLLITNPADNLTVTSANVTVTGKTDAAASVTVNDRQVIVQPDGQFSTSVTLVSGSNTIVIATTDSAGNTSKVSKTVLYSASQASESATPQ
jgi:hypothetical protein